MNADRIMLEELEFNKLTSATDLVYYKSVGYNQIHLALYDTGVATMKLVSRDLEITRHKQSVTTEEELREFISKFYFLLLKIGVDTNGKY